MLRVFRAFWGLGATVSGVKEHQVQRALRDVGNTWRLMVHPGLAGKVVGGLGTAKSGSHACSDESSYPLWTVICLFY